MSDPRGAPWTVEKNNRGFIVCRPRYWALEDRADPEWEAAERALHGDHKFEIMQGERWDVPAGTPLLPLFAERVREVSPWKFEGFYVRDCPDIFSNLYILRGYDGGLHRPAMVLCQYDRSMGLLWAMRELRPLTPSGQPIDFQAHEFVALCRFMCGQATQEQLRQEERDGKWSTAAALAWIEQERRSPFYGWDMPWIKPGTMLAKGFADSMQAHELRRMDQLAPRPELNSLYKVYRQQGIRMQISSEGWEHRELCLGFLLGEGPKAGIPRLLVDSSCKTLLKGMAGGLAQSQPGARKPYVEDRWLEDALDAFLNAMCLAFPLQHADRLVALDRQHEEARRIAMGREAAPQRGTRPHRPAWAALRSSYNEDR